MKRWAVHFTPLWGAAVWLGISGPSFAQQPEESFDFELLRPSFGQDSLVAVELPRVADSWTVRAATMLQYQREPLTLYDVVTNEDIAPIVRNRLGLMAGASLDIGPVTAGVVLPAAVTWGSLHPAFDADGVGLGDLSLGARWTVVRTRLDKFNVGVRGGVYLPTGRRDRYFGDNTVRATGGAMVASQWGPVALAADLGFMARITGNGSRELDFGPEVTWGVGGRWSLPQATRVAVNAQLFGRSAISELARPTSPSHAVEGLVGVEVYATRATTFALNVGRGLTVASGTTDLRVIGGVMWTFGPSGAQEPYRYPIHAPPPPEEFDEPDRWVTGCHGLGLGIVDTRYIIRDRVEFYDGTANLRPESVPVLNAVADLLNATPEIGFLMVEGHASQEGGFADNYALADARARRVWEMLLERGVANQRIGYRSAGSVEPVVGIVGDQTLSDHQLQQNRRVEFRIVQHLELDEIPEYPERQYLPWSGEIVDVVQPIPPVEEESGEFEEFEEFEEFDEFDD